jgi:hypothetical protein
MHGITIYIDEIIICTAQHRTYVYAVAVASCGGPNIRRMDTVVIMWTTLAGLECTYLYIDGMG